MALELIEIGHYVVHPRNQGGMSEPDHAVLARATRENLVIVTENAMDFRGLVAREEKGGITKMLYPLLGP